MSTVRSADPGCTLPGGRGAPVTEQECSEIEQAMPSVEKYLPQYALNRIRQAGFWEGMSGQRALECIDRKDCVFVFYEGNIAKCALEKAYNNGETTFRKPLSCHLFPIRISKERTHDHLHVERIPECNGGYKNGEEKKIPVTTFLREALIRAYGEEAYKSIRKA
jgi:hypothetical protein